MIADSPGPRAVAGAGALAIATSPVPARSLNQIDESVIAVEPLLIAVTSACSTQPTSTSPKVTAEVSRTRPVLCTRLSVRVLPASRPSQAVTARTIASPITRPTAGRAGPAPAGAPLTVQAYW